MFAQLVSLFLEHYTSCSFRHGVLVLQLEHIPNVARIVAH